MSTNYGELDASLQAKLDADNDFQATLADLSDEDKESAIETKKSELFQDELKSLKDKAEKASKAEELANNYKVRAEKAEQEAKKLAGESTPKNDGMSLKDIRALQDVHDDDVDELVEYAKFKKISIPEAKKLPEMQSLLKTKEEQRKVADATNVGTSKRSSGKVPDDVLLSNAMKGILPDVESEDFIRLQNLRRPKKN